MICPKCARPTDDDAVRCSNCKEVLRLDLSGNEEVPNYLILSILVSIFCCTPFGLVSLFFAIRANNLVKKGDRTGALLAAKRAKATLLFTLAAGLIFMVIVFTSEFPS